VAASGTWFDCLIGCFVLILSFCIFLELLMCHLVIGGQKAHDLCNDCITAPLTKGGRGIRTSDLQFIKCGPNRLNYLLRIIANLLLF
jgi:hypothetical protein